ncbi:MAG: MoaD/ThiS family protein [Firmicutes bacterium]|jgi:molybdopterin converting factor small subunit|nr:MoaD/ThiS family protein [Bacillota bacterium]MDH7496785.1 MoaD/ThiS family protein [Bacillota bacterium]
MSISVSVRLVFPWDHRETSVECPEGAKLGQILEEFLERKRKDLERDCPDGMKRFVQSLLDGDFAGFLKSSMVLLNQERVAVSEGGLDKEVSGGSEILVIPPIISG